MAASDRRAPTRAASSSPACSDSRKSASRRNTGQSRDSISPVTAARSAPADTTSAHASLSAETRAEAGSVSVPPGWPSIDGRHQPELSRRASLRGAGVCAVTVSSRSRASSDTTGSPHARATAGTLVRRTSAKDQVSMTARDPRDPGSLVSSASARSMASAGRPPSARWRHSRPTPTGSTPPKRASSDAMTRGASRAASSAGNSSASSTRFPFTSTLPVTGIATAVCSTSPGSSRVQDLRPRRHLKHPRILVRHRLRRRAEEPRVPQRHQPLRGRALKEVADSDVVLGKGVPQLASVAPAGLLHLEQLVQPSEHICVPVLETLQQAVQQALETVNQLGELPVRRPRPIKGAAMRAHRQPPVTGGQLQPEHGRLLLNGHPQLLNHSLDTGGMTALLLNRIQDEPDRALDLPVKMTDQMGQSPRLRLMGKQLARRSEPLSNSLANLLAQTINDTFLPRREARRQLLSRYHSDPFSNAPNATRPDADGQPMRAGLQSAWDAYSRLQGRNLQRRWTRPPGRDPARPALRLTL
jgi:hypothetical protein